MYVDRAARTLLGSKLTGSQFGNEDTIDKMVQNFESNNKRTYGAGGGRSPSIIKFGADSDQDRAASIAMGRLTLTRSVLTFSLSLNITDDDPAASNEVEKMFAFCEKEIVASIKSQIKMGTSSSSVSDSSRSHDSRTHSSHNPSTSSLRESVQSIHLCRSRSDVPS